MKLHERVRIYLEEHALRPADVARRAKIPLSTLGDLLDGRRAIYPEELRAISAALGVCPEFFIECKSQERGVAARNEGG